MTNLKDEKWRADARRYLPGLVLKSAMLACALTLSGCGASIGDDHSPSAMAEKIGRPQRLLIRLGTTEVADIRAQKINIDILDRYLVGVGKSSWVNWSSPRGEYIRFFTEQADSIGAVPMFTLYQMASNREGNLSGLMDRKFMSDYWDNVQLLFQRLAQYDSPAIVNLAPNFWGYAQKQAPGGYPSALRAWVSINPDCVDLPDNVVGIAACQMRLASKHAPRVLMGFPISDWGASTSTPEEVIRFMNRLGADQADFIVFPTSDRDAGCFEQVPQPEDCERAGEG